MELEFLRKQLIDAELCAKELWMALKPEEQFTEDTMIEQHKGRQSSLSQGWVTIPQD